MRCRKLKFGEDLFQIILYLLHVIQAKCFIPFNGKKKLEANVVLKDDVIEKVRFKFNYKVEWCKSSFCVGKLLWNWRA